MARFANTIDNQPIYAARAEADKNGDRIDTTYAKLTDIPDVPVQDVEVDGTSVVNAQGVAEITLPTFTQEQANWNESDSSDPSYIQNKPNVKPVVAGSNVQITEDANSFTISATDTTYSAGNNITISGGVISATAEPQVQADWTEADSTSKAYIQNKPDLSVYAQSSSLATVATTGDYDDLVNKPSIPAAQVNSDWSAASGVAAILNKPNLATVATSGNYNDLSNLPTIPPAVTVDQHYDALSSNPQSGTAVAEALSGTGQVPTVTSSDDSKVLMASYSGGQGSYSWQPTAAATQVNSDWEATSGVAEILHKPDLSVYAETADLATVATTGSYNDLSDKPSIPAAQVNADWNASSGVAQILNKPTIPAAQVQSNWNEADSTSKAYIQNKPDLSVYAQSSSLATVATTGDYDDLSNKPSIPAAQVNADWDAVSGVSQILNKPNLATVATSGSYNDLSNKPTIPDAPVQSNWTESDSSSLAYIQNKPSLATVATSGSYADLSNKPTIPTVDQTYSAISTNAQSGTAVADALSYISQVPSTSQASAGDVLTVDQYGDPEWASPAAQEQSDWEESDPTAVSYIQHKPSQKTLVGGQNIVLTESANNITIDCTASSGSSVVVLTYGTSTWSDFTAALATTKDIIVEETATTGTNYYVFAKLNKNAFTQAITDAVFSSIGTATMPRIVTLTTASAWSRTNTSLQQALTAGTGIDITSNTVSVENPLPASTSSDEGKVLKVNASGTPEWGTGGSAQVQADWTEADSSDPSYIQNKPTLATVATSGSYNDLLNLPTIPTVPVQDVEVDGVSVLNAQGVAEITMPSIPVTDVEVNGTSVVNASGVAEITLPTFTQAQADWTEADSSDPSYIQNKPTLATVATSGSYNDLTDKPTIPTVPVTDVTVDGTSVVSNGTAVITMPSIPVTDVEVDGVSVLNAQGVAEITMPTFTQAQADWTESDSSDPSYIQHKPTLATVATSGAYSDLSGTPTLATVATSGSYADLSNKPTIPTVDQVYDGTSANAQSGVAVASALSGKQDTISDLNTIRTGAGLGATAVQPSDLATVATTGDYGDLLNKPTIPAAPVQSNWTESDSSSLAYIQNKPSLATVATSGAYSDLTGTPTINNVPAVTSSDDAKVLKASYTGGVGSYSWETESGGTQVQSDWTESDTTDPSYIQNKPTVMGIVAGSNVTITESASSLTIAATDTTYTAGTGLNLSNGEFSVDSTVVALQSDIPSVPVTDVTVDGTSVVSNGTAAITMPTVPTAGNMLSVTNGTLNVTTTAGITDIQQVASLPANPVATVLYLIPET